MRTIETVLYKYNELSEAGKQKAREHLSDINVDFDWWESTYWDAKEIGLKITGFDIERGSYVKGELIYSVEKCCDLIMENHGEMCETYLQAKSYKNRLLMLPNNSDESEYGDLCSEIEEDFLKEICDCYLTILRDEYEYQTSEEAVIETIEANEYEFTEDGKLA